MAADPNVGIVAPQFAGSTPASFPVPAALMADPAYAAFRAQLSKGQGDLEGQAASQSAAINKAMQDRLPQMGTADQHAQDRIGGQMEARGLYGSGQLDQGLADEAQQAGYRYSALNNDTHARMLAIAASLGQRVANLYAGDPAQELAAMHRLALAQGQDQIAASTVAPIVGHAAPPLILPALAAPAAPVAPSPAQAVAAQRTKPVSKPVGAATTRDLLRPGLN